MYACMPGKVKKRQRNVFTQHRVARSYYGDYSKCTTIDLPQHLFEEQMSLRARSEIMRHNYEKSQQSLKSIQKSATDAVYDECLSFHKLQGRDSITPNDVIAFYNFKRERAQSDVGRRRSSVFMEEGDDIFDSGRTAFSLPANRVTKNVSFENMEPKLQVRKKSIMPSLSKRMSFHNVTPEIVKKNLKGVILDENL